MKATFLTLALAAGAFALPGCGTLAQERVEGDEKVERLISSGEYVFEAEMALPMSGSSRYLTGEYHLSIEKDQITADLPYFGRAFQAPADLRGGGIRFESKDFEYEVKERRKGGWDIDIEPNDAEGIRNMSLTVSVNGSASLRVNSDQRQPISFNGYISAPEER